MPEIHVSIARLTVGSTYKMIFVGLVFSLVPLSIAFGVMAVFGADTVFWNGQPIHGWAGLVSSLFMGLFVAGLFTLFLGTACLAGHWLHSKWRPLRLAFVAAPDASAEEA